MLRSRAAHQGRVTAALDDITRKLQMRDWKLLHILGMNMEPFRASRADEGRQPQRHGEGHGPDQDFAHTDLRNMQNLCQTNSYLYHIFKIMGLNKYIDELVLPDNQLNGGCVDVKNESQCLSF